MKLRLFLLLACAYMLIASREPPWGDAHVVYDTVQNLVEHGRIDVSPGLGGPPWFYSVRNGKKYGVFPLGNVIAMTPSYLAYKAVRAIPHKPAIEELLYRFCSHLSPSLLAAGVCVLFFVLARREGATERVALWLSLLLGTGTIVLVYARVAFSEALQTLVFTWVVERALTVGDRLTRRGAFFLGLACGVLFNTKLVYAVPIAVVPVYLVLRHRRRPRELAICLAIAAAPLALLAGFAIWHNHLKTGMLVDSGYRIPGGVFSGDAYAGLAGYFLSTGKSIFLYSPPLILGFFAFADWLRRDRAHAGFVIAITAVVTLMNAKFRYWHADYCWGPRLLVPLVPAWLLATAGWIEGALARGRRRVRALATGALVGAALWVQVLGASFYWDHYINVAIAVKDQTGAGTWYTEDLHHCHFIPQFSPIVGHAWLLRHVAHRDPDLYADAPFRRVIAGKVNLLDRWVALRFDLWLVEWGQVREARAWMFAVLALLVGGVSACALGLRRPREEPERAFRIAGVRGR